MWFSYCWCFQTDHWIRCDGKCPGKGWGAVRQAWWHGRKGRGSPLSKPAITSVFTVHPLQVWASCAQQLYLDTTRRWWYGVQGLIITGWERGTFLSPILGKGMCHEEVAMLAPVGYFAIICVCPSLFCLNLLSTKGPCKHGSHGQLYATARGVSTAQKCVLRLCLV